jgi:peptidylprolyl isomerase
VSSRSAFKRSAGLLAALTVLVTAAACSSSSTSPAPATSAGASATTGADLTGVKVAGAAGAKPSVTAATPFTVQQTSTRVLAKGTGPVVAKGQNVTVDYAGFNGADGKEFDTSFGEGKTAPTFLLDDQALMPGLYKGIVGQTVGSRVLVAIPPADGFGTQGNATSGIGPTDTLLIVVDVKSARSVLTRATGTAVPPKAGLPTVKLGSNGAPTITVPTGNPPAQLVVQPLITGTGAKVAKGQQITVHYTGVIWPGGKQFDSSWTKGAPATFAIGAGRVIPGWDEGLVGQAIGSQILLVIPPDKRYGAQGDANAGIKGTDTLVFVVDILDAG